MMKLLYFPAGPGMNANPEYHLLHSLYQGNGIELECWHEPSRLRPDSYPYRKEAAFQNYLDCAESFLLRHYEGTPVPVLAFCFGSQALKYLLFRHPDKISKAFITTPDYCVKEADVNMLTLVRDDYRENGAAAEACRLDEIIPHCTGRFDALTEEGFRLYMQNPRILDFYWSDKEIMKVFVQHFNGRYQLDYDSFFDCRQSVFDLPMANCPVPAVVVFGKKDRLISIPAEKENIKYMYNNHKVIEMDASHYPHIEQRKAFLEIIKKELAA